MFLKPGSKLFAAAGPRCACWGLSKTPGLHVPDAFSQLILGRESWLWRETEDKEALGWIRLLSFFSKKPLRKLKLG